MLGTAEFRNIAFIILQVQLQRMLEKLHYVRLVWSEPTPLVRFRQSQIADSLPPFILINL